MAHVGGRVYSASSRRFAYRHGYFCQTEGAAHASGRAPGLAQTLFNEVKEHSVFLPGLPAWRGESSFTTEEVAWGKWCEQHGADHCAMDQK